MRSSLTHSVVIAFSLLILAVPVVSLAQAQIDLPSFAALQRKAVNSVDISLNPSLIKLASEFVSQGNEDPAVSAAIRGLKGIYVRSFQFATAGAYSTSDVERVRKQLAAPGWVRLVSVHNTHSSPQHQNVDVYLREQGNRVEGLVIIAAAPKELTIVNLVGSVDLATLSKLQGKFGVPRLPLGHPTGGT